MNKQILLILIVLNLFFCSFVHGQVKIGNNPATIADGSLFEMESSTKGLRLPRIALNDSTKWTLDGTAVSGMMIYNESGSLTKGIYYWNTTLSQWVRVVNKTEFAKLIIENKEIRDSITSVVNNTITNGTIKGKNLTSTSAALKVFNGTGATLTDAKVDLDSTALGHMLNTSPVKDSLAIAITKKPVTDSLAQIITNNTTIRDSIKSVLKNTVTADNGLTATSGNVQLGGALTKATTITTTATNTLAISGLQQAAITDSVVTIDPATGVLHQRALNLAMSSIVVKTSDYTVTANDYTVVFNGAAAATFTLPASPENGRTYRFVNISSAYDINFSTSIITMNGGTTSKLGIGTTYINGNILGNKITIQYATGLGWVQVAN